MWSNVQTCECILFLRHTQSANKRTSERHANTEGGRNKESKWRIPVHVSPHQHIPIKNYEPVSTKFKEFRKPYLPNAWLFEHRQTCISICMCTSRPRAGFVIEQLFLLLASHQKYAQESTWIIQGPGDEKNIHNSLRLSNIYETVGCSSGSHVKLKQIIFSW